MTLVLANFVKMVALVTGTQRTSFAIVRHILPVIDARSKW